MEFYPMGKTLGRPEKFSGSIKRKEILKERMPFSITQIRERERKIARWINRGLTYCCCTTDGFWAGGHNPEKGGTPGSKLKSVFSIVVEKFVENWKVAAHENVGEYTRAAASPLRKWPTWQSLTWWRAWMMPGWFQWSLHGDQGQTQQGMKMQTWKKWRGMERQPLKQKVQDICSPVLKAYFLWKQLGSIWW